MTPETEASPTVEDFSNNWDRLINADRALRTAEDLMTPDRLRAPDGHKILVRRRDGHSLGVSKMMKFSDGSAQGIDQPNGFPKHYDDEHPFYADEVSLGTKRDHIRAEFRTYEIGGVYRSYRTYNDPLEDYEIQIVPAPSDETIL